MKIPASSLQYCVLLTGTICPDNVFSLGRIDPVLREQDYYLAIKKWLKTGYKVVFCENSNFRSERIDGLMLRYDNFEFLQYKEESDLGEKGKGFGEYKIIDYALAMSNFIQNSDLIIKVTGRLYVRNFKKIMRKSQSLEFDILAPLELNLKWADSRFYIFKKSFHIDFFSRYAPKINDSAGYCFERALAAAIHFAIAENRKWEMMPVFPLYQGFSGTENQAYSFFNVLSIRKFFRFPVIRWLLK